MKIWMPSIQSESGSTVYIHRLADALTKQGVQVNCQWFSKAFEFYPYLLKQVKPPKETDLIFANSWSAIGFTGHKQPLVNVIHHCVHDDAYVPYKSVLQKLYHELFIHPYENRGILRSDKLIAVSNYTANSVSNVFHCRYPQVIYNSIDTEKYNPLYGKKRHGIFKLVFIGNVSRRKGFDLLPHIMNKLGNQFRLYFTSGLRNTIINNIPNSQCVGHLTEDSLIDLYRNCDAMLFPTRYEGFGYSVAEAMACGLPVVATDCSSLPELIDHGKGGFLCPLGDVQAFADSINRLAEDPHLRKAMGEYNRSKIEESFTLQRMAMEYQSLFEEILDTPLQSS